MALPNNRRRKSSDDQVPSPFSSGGLLDELFKDLDRGFFGSSSLGRFGNTDIYEENGTLHYEMELPGLGKDDIETKVKGDQLVVTGETRKRNEKEDANYIHRGRRYGKFRRTFGLPEEVKDPEKVCASFEDGVLDVEVDLSESLTEEDTVEIEIE
ncbi:Hsp20/alpha crystallin family protein [Candidatus Bipolaricaulota bacterium]|nr:Hsp20/alpha crystallin family protein [Candidatus Bipolaricaulota bacterium]